MICPAYKTERKSATKTSATQNFANFRPYLNGQQTCATRKAIKFGVDQGQFGNYSSVHFMREKRVKLSSREVAEIVFTPEL
ncbi:MAG: hypothetical protein GY820_02615 [Gammaproteobacteria bacterium]|nr:hypothetical protein [Gammaproteobacteria bacterium]